MDNIVLYTMEGSALAEHTSTSRALTRRAVKPGKKEKSIVPGKSVGKVQHSWKLIAHFPYQ